jgi:parallel beta-helix repeat protein
MNRFKFRKFHKIFSLITLISISLTNLSAKELDVVTTQLVLTGGENISGKHFRCEEKNPYIAVVVSGDNVTIENSLFTGCYAGIIISGAKNTTIKGNRFEDVGLAIRERRNEYRESTKRTTVIFNEFKGVGTKNCLEAPEWIDGAGHDYWACDVFLANGGSSFGKFNNNLIDNRGKTTKYIEDFINIGDGSHNYEVKNNILIGSTEPKSSSGTGACVVIDTRGSNFNISGNQCYNAATTGYANAGGDNVSINDNLVYITKKHALATWNHPHNRGTFRGDTTGISSSPYGNRSCGKNTRVRNNKSYTYYVDYDRSGNLRDTGTTHNWEDGFGTCKNYAYLQGNQFNTHDPKWKIPNNLFANLSKEYFSGKGNKKDNNPTPPTPPIPNGDELIQGGGNANGRLDISKWSWFGSIYGLQGRRYNGKSFIYSTPKDNGSGMYQGFSTQIGKEYEVSAILIGSDSNRKEQFNGYSYLTISSERPTPNGTFVSAQSENITGGEESFVSFTFVATSTTTYLALRSDRAWHYASARAISVKKVDGSSKPTPPVPPTPSGEELIQGGGNANGRLNISKWFYFGSTYGRQGRNYRGESYIYSTPKDTGSGMYQRFKTEVGKTYNVSALLIGSDTNRKEQFNGYSYLTISSAKPTSNRASTIVESKHIRGSEEQAVNFTFVAKSSMSYLALRSDRAWHYASARAISVKKQ